MAARRKGLASLPSSAGACRSADGACCNSGEMLRRSRCRRRLGAGARGALHLVVDGTEMISHACADGSRTVKSACAHTEGRNILSMATVRNLGRCTNFFKTGLEKPGRERLGVGSAGRKGLDRA